MDGVDEFERVKDAFRQYNIDNFIDIGKGLVPYIDTDSDIDMDTDADIGSDTDSDTDSIVVTESRLNNIEKVFIVSASLLLYYFW